MTRNALIRQRARLLLRAGSHRARCAALAPLSIGEKLVALDYAYHGAKGPIAPSATRVLADLDKQQQPTG